VTVSLVDIRDVRGYVARVVERKFSETPGASREELISEGVAYLYELHAKWDPERCESFADFASTYLPLRLIDYWRKEMRQMNVARRNGDDQSYKYSGRAESLQQMAESGQDLPAPEQEPLSELSPLLDSALGKVPKWERLGIRQMVKLTEEGHSEMEISRTLGIPWQELNRLRATFQIGIVEALRGDQSDAEIQRYLGVPSALVNQLRPTGVMHDQFAAAA
jgi:hypothetical protein